MQYPIDIIKREIEMRQSEVIRQQERIEFAKRTITDVSEIIEEEIEMIECLEAAVKLLEAQGASEN